MIQPLSACMQGEREFGDNERDWRPRPRSRARPFAHACAKLIKSGEGYKTGGPARIRCSSFSSPMSRPRHSTNDALLPP